VERFPYKKVHVKNLYPSIKPSCLPAGNIDETPDENQA